MSIKRSIPFEFFRPNEVMYFDIGRIAKLERELGVPIITVMSQIEESICSAGFILAACRAGLAHHYRDKPGVMEECVNDYLERGGSLFDAEFLMSINRALVASGLFGKEIADKAVRNELNVVAEEESTEVVDEKNAETASE